VEPQDFEDLMGRLFDVVLRMDTAIDGQRAINDRLEAAIEELRTFNRQQVAINTDVKTTLARLETLMTRVFRGEGGNGRES
jgi:hypothetical protein